MENRYMYVKKQNKKNHEEAVYRNIQWYLLKFKLETDTCTLNNVYSVWCLVFYSVAVLDLTFFSVDSVTCSALTEVCWKDCIQVVKC